MKYLIMGAGTIGITYAWLLSQENEVDIYIRQERVNEFINGYSLSIKDLRKQTDMQEKYDFKPHFVTDITDFYDAILVAVNRFQLKDVLPILKEKQEQTKYIIFMQNHWNIKMDLENQILDKKYFVAFPSSIGGGREKTSISVIIFDEATRLGGSCKEGIALFQESLNKTNIKTIVDNNMFDWLKVHYLQQSITAGAILEKGSYEEFAKDYNSIKKMVKAFREGIKVCKLQGVNTKKTFPANLFKLPVFIIAPTMQKMFLDNNTGEMINNHMKKGLSEWAMGYEEVLNDGIALGLPMYTWKSYSSYINSYLDQQQ